MSHKEARPADFQVSGEVLGEIFTTYQKISIPAYQRSYDWTEKEWGDLWSDLLESAPSNREYFMGPLNAERLPSGDGIHLADGQQRITTLTILLSALKLKLPNERFAEVNNLLFVEPGFGQGDGRRPRLNDQSAEGNIAIRKVLDRTTVIPPDEISTRHDRAFNYFCLKMRDMTPADAVELFQFVTKKLIFARVVAQETGSGIKMFERSNTRGRALTLTDKLKSLLIGSAPVADAPEVIENWSKTVERLRSVKKYDDRRFVDWLSADFGDEEKTIRASEALDLARRVVAEFGARACSIQLADYATAVASIWSGRSPISQKEVGSLVNLQNFSRFSQLMRILPASRALSEESFVLLAEAVENTVCVIAIAKAFPPDIEKSVPGLLKTCRDVRDGNTDVKEIIKGLHSIRDAYAHSFGDKLVNGTLADFSQRSHLRVLWGLMDQYMLNLNRSKNARIPRQRIKLSDISIEHILPQSSSARIASKEYGAHFASQDRQRVSNLTPLENGLNYGTKPYSEKSKNYVNSSFLLTKSMSPKFADAGLRGFRDVRMKYLPPYKRWDRSQLELRARRLQGLACSALELSYVKVEFRAPDSPSLESPQYFPRIASFRTLADGLQLFSDGGRPQAKELSTLRFIGLIEELDSEDSITEIGEEVLRLGIVEQAIKLRELALEVPYVAVWRELSVVERKNLVEQDVLRISGKAMPTVSKQIVACLTTWTSEKMR